jgi:hypothetical protein
VTEITPSEFELRLNRVDAVILTPIVQRLFEQDALTLIDWTWQPVPGGSAKAVGIGLGIYRFLGHARIQGDAVPWSMILKASRLFNAEQQSVASGNEQQTSWNYWKREALAYTSGLLEGIQGELIAPRCYGVVEYPNNEVWIWLEDIHEDGGGKWSLKQFGIAAYHLGQFNGAYLAGQPLPNEPWLTRGRVRVYLEVCASLMPELRSLATHPLVGRWLSVDDIERILLLWYDQERYLSLFDRLPRCLCHHDAYRRNLLARRDPHGREQTVAIDWAILGTGAVGEEIATLVTTSLRWLDGDMADASTLDAIVFQKYLAGLRQAGWEGDEALVRFGYTTAATYFNGVGGLIFLQFLLDPQYHPLLEQVFGYQLEQILAQWAELQGFLLDLSEEMQLLHSSILTMIPTTLESK